MNDKMNKVQSTQDEFYSNDSSEEDIFGEIRETYHDLDLSPGELFKQHILALNWTIRKARERGMVKNVEILTVLLESVRKHKLSSLTTLLTEKNIFFDPIAEVISLEIQDAIDGSKINDPFEFFFASAILLFQADANPNTAYKNRSPKDAKRLSSDSIIAEENIIDQSDMSSEVKAIIPDLVSAGNYLSLRLCVFPGCQNPETAIKAHSISKSNFLKPYVSSNKKIWYIATPKAPKVGRPEFDSIEVSNASCFTGLCRDHDAIFHPLDNSKPLECLNSSRLLSLMTFRTALYGYWQCLDTDYRRPVFGWYATVRGNRINGLKHVKKTVRLPIPIEVSRDQLRDLANVFWENIQKEQWEAIEHHIFEFSGTGPRVISAGVSAIFADQGIFTPAFIHIFPNSSGMIAIVSHMKTGGDRLRNRLRWLRSISKEKQKKILTWAAMHHCRNLYFTEQYYESLTETTKSNIIDMAIVFGWLPTDPRNPQGEPTISTSAAIYEKIKFSFFG